MSNDYMGVCVDCGLIKTSNRDGNEFVCAVCSNERYSKKVSNGEIVILKLDMTKVKRSTLLTIKALITKDMEE